MQLCSKFPRTEELIESFASDLGADLPAYRNHVCRVLNYFSALTEQQGPIPESVLIAAAFHDIGIWTDKTFDYLEPSVRRAKAYLSSRGITHEGAEVEAIITEHHKIRAYRDHHEANVEAFRKADLVDVSLGRVRFGLPPSFVRSVKVAFPNEGFHWRLVALTAGQLRRTPLRPLPMFHW
jgi:predicted metal-dependent HD superfamily phosphohydrolase